MDYSARVEQSQEMGRLESWHRESGLLNFSSTPVIQGDGLATNPEAAGLLHESIDLSFIFVQFVKFVAKSPSSDRRQPPITRIFRIFFLLRTIRAIRGKNLLDRHRHTEGTSHELHEFSEPSFSFE